MKIISDSLLVHLGQIIQKDRIDSLPPQHPIHITQILIYLHQHIPHRLNPNPNQQLLIKLPNKLLTTHILHTCTTTTRLYWHPKHNLYYF